MGSHICEIAGERRHTDMRLSFISSIFLWLFLLLPPLWALTLSVPQRLARWRFWSSLLLRTLALTGLILALAGAQLVYPVGAVTAVFLLDGSDSISLSQRARAERFIQQALAAMPTDDRAAIVVFGQQSLVERTPSADRTLGQIVSRPGGGTTNIQDALQLGLALLPAEGNQRLVLLSDGGENQGDAAAAARLAAARNIPIDIVTLSGIADGPDAQVSSIELPAASREGQRLRLRIELASNTAATGRLTIIGPGDVTLADEQVAALQGTRYLEVTLPEAGPGFNRYIVRFAIPNDTQPENDAAEAYTFVSGRPRVLLVEGSPGAAATLSAALSAAQIDVTSVAPAGVPDNVGALSFYDAVVLIDTARRALPDRTLTALSAYVHDLGRGLMMVGGPQSFGAGGWRDTPVEEALPVSMDIPTQLRFPPASIVVVIDISGSMAAEEGGRSKLQLAAEGAQRIAALMRDEDDLTVIPFDSKPQGVIATIPGSRRDEAIDRLSRVQPGGGGINIHDALVEAAKYVRQSDKPLRHIITITDGSDTTQQEGALVLVRELNSEGVTLTSISVGDGPHTPFIRDMAQFGKGRTFLTDQAANIPDILVDETQAVIQPYIIEETFTPARGAPHPLLRGIDQAPPLHGYVITTPRQTAQVLLAAPRGEPVLAAWQYGLGRTLAWTSDFKGQWGRDWVAGESFPSFAAQLVGWLLPPQNQQRLTLQATAVRDELLLNAQAQDDLGRPKTGLQTVGRLLAADGSGIDIPLREVGPGQYRAAVRGVRPGAYLAQIIARDARGEPFAAVTGGAVMPSSAEYRNRNANVALLDGLARLSGGRIDADPTTTFDPGGPGVGAVREIGLPLLWAALILLPFDVGVRRLLFRRRQLATARAELQAPAGEVRKPRFVLPKFPSSEQQTADSERPANIAPDLDRLREAQERARKRARGEE